MKKVIFAFGFLLLITQVVSATTMTDVANKTVKVTYYGHYGATISDTIAIGQNGAYEIFCQHIFVGTKARLMFLGGVNLSALEMDLSNRTTVATMELKTLAECQSMEAALKSASESNPISINSESGDSFKIERLK